MAMGRRPADGGECEMRELIGAHLRELRERKGWTQREAARRLRMARQTIALIERGLCFPTWSTSFRMVKAYGGSLCGLARRIECEFGYVGSDEDNVVQLAAAGGER